METEKNKNTERDQWIMTMFNNILRKENLDYVLKGDWGLRLLYGVVGNKRNELYDIPGEAYLPYFIRDLKRLNFNEKTINEIKTTIADFLGEELYKYTKMPIKRKHEQDNSISYKQKSNV